MNSVLDVDLVYSNETRPMTLATDTEVPDANSKMGPLFTDQSCIST